jgi:hypothetical protein
VWIRSAERRAADGYENCSTGVSELRHLTDGIASRMNEMREQPASSQPAPRAGLNLGKRSQALRMHRRGDSADQIAASLEVPRQEVELLLKVHRIVMSSVM